MDKTKLAILVGLLLALFFFASLEAEASTEASDIQTSETYTSTFPLPEEKIWMYELQNTNVYEFQQDLELTTPLTYGCLCVGSLPKFALDKSSNSTGTLEYSYSVIINGEEYIIPTSGCWVYPAEYDSIIPNVVLRCNFKVTVSDSSDSLVGYTQVIYASGYDGTFSYYYATRSTYGLIDKLNVMISQNSTLGNSLWEAMTNTNSLLTDILGKMNLTFSTLGGRITNSIEVMEDSLNTHISQFWSELKSHMSSIRDEEENQLDGFQTSMETYLTDFEAHFDTWDVYFERLYRNINITLTSLRSSIEEYMYDIWDKTSAQMTAWQTAIDKKLDDVIEAITKSYDSSGAENTNSELSGSLDSWEAAEGQTMSDAKIEVSAYDTSSAFDFAPALVSSLSLVTAFSTGFLNASGDFSTAITVMFSLVFVSVLVGLVRFVRR